MAKGPRKITDRRLNSNRRSVVEPESGVGKGKRAAPKPKKG